MHIQAIGAIVYLRDPEVDEIHQIAGESTLHDICIDAAEGLGTVRSNLITVWPVRHSTILFSFGGGCELLVFGIYDKHSKQLRRLALLALRLIEWSAPGGSDQLGAISCGAILPLFQLTPGAGHFVGLDVSQDITHVCIVGSDGKPIWQGTWLSTCWRAAGVRRQRSLQRPPRFRSARTRDRRITDHGPRARFRKLGDLL